MHWHLLASDVSKLLKHCFQIINLWQSISHPALDWPVALCNYCSIDLKDVMPVALIYPNSDFEGEMMGISYNENHKWKYYHEVTPEEVILIKM